MYDNRRSSDEYLVAMETWNKLIVWNKLTFDTQIIAFKIVDYLF